MQRYVLPLLAVAVSFPANALAHFPFLHLKSQDEGPTALHVYFAETAEPDDPALLDRLGGAEAWRIEANGESQPLALKKGENSLMVPVSGSGPAAYVLRKDYGVLARGGQLPFRLMYYAKTHSGRDAWEIDTADRLRLDIVPSRKGDELTLTILWNGKPLPEAEVIVQGGIESIEGKTDAEGRFTCRPSDPDLFSIRAKHVEAGSGEREGERYDETRHYATLTLDLD